MADGLCRLVATKTEAHSMSVSVRGERVKGSYRVQIPFLYASETPGTVRHKGPYTHSHTHPGDTHTHVSTLRLHMEMSPY